MNFKVSLRANILADILERRRLLAEARHLRAQLKALTELRQQYAAEKIAERHQTRVRQVNAIAASICWEADHTPKK